MKLSTRGIVLTAFVGAGAIALSACTPPLPPDVLAAQAEKNITCQQGAQEVSLPADFTGSIDMVNSSLTGACAEQSMTEVAADAPAGLKIIDHAPTADDLSAFAANCPSGTIVVPAFAYGVVPAYNIIGLEGLVLPPDVIAGILSGTITKWDDPAIVAANPGVDLTGLPDITVMSVDQPQGAVEAETAWLSKEAPKSWTGGTVGTLPNSTTFPTITDLLAEMTVTDGAFAILPAVDAVANTLPMAVSEVQDQTVSADDSALLKIGSGATTVTTDDKGNITASAAIGGVPLEGNFDAAAAKIVLAEGQQMVGWPVVGYAHMLVCDDPANPLPLSSAQYIARLAGQGSLETFGVTPLPEPIRVKMFTPLKVTLPSGAPIEPAASSAAPAPTS